MIQNTNLVKGDFKYTGKSKPVTVDKCIKFVIGKLRNYDNNIGDISESPYNSKIIMEIDNGKFVEIPHEIQHEAVKKWLATKGVDDVKETNNINTISKSIKKKTNDSQLLVFILFGLISLLAGYYISQKN